MRALWGRRQSLSHPGGPGLAPAWPQARAATAGHGHCSEEHGLLLPRQQAVRGGRHGLDVDLGRDTWISWEMPAPGCWGRAPSPAHSVCREHRDLGGPPAGVCLTSLTACVRIWMIFSCGVATTLCPLISMMRCPTRMPPFSAMPPRIRLQIWGAGSAAEIRAVLVPRGLHHDHPKSPPPATALGLVLSPPAQGPANEHRDGPWHCCGGICAELHGKNAPQAFGPLACTELLSPHPHIEPHAPVPSPWDSSSCVLVG